MLTTERQTHTTIMLSPLGHERELHTSQPLRRARDRRRRGRLGGAVLVRCRRRLRLHTRWHDQHKGKGQSDVHGGHDWRPSSTRTSRIMPASMW